MDWIISTFTWDNLMHMVLGVSVGVNIALTTVINAKDRAIRSYVEAIKDYIEG